MNETQQHIDQDEVTIRTGIQAGDQYMGSGGATSGGGDNDPSRNGGFLGSGT
jgi:hypothetical protein